MSLTPDEAAQSLRDVSDAEQRSTQAAQYARSAPFFTLWGTFWVLGYTATEFWPHMANAIWTCLSFPTIALHSFIAYRTTPASRRLGILFSVIFLFVIANFAIMQPTQLQISAFWPLLMAALYIGFGLWVGVRFIVAGIVVAIATLFGFFALPEHFHIWMAVLVGGTLILTGFWMRKV
jgi:hypothetical protein